VRASRDQQDRGGCVYCGVCMYGCPYAYIYSASPTLTRLMSSRNFRYEPGIIVTSVSEGASAARIEGYNRADGAPFSAEAAQVYLAAGVIPTTQILLGTSSLYDQSVSMKDSQYFLFPMIFTKSVGAVAAESLHTLSQLFLEIVDGGISPHTVHLQVYSYNDLIGQTVRASFGPVATYLEPLMRDLEGRLLIVQGYLHSAHSAQITMRLTKGPPDRLA